MTSDNTIRFQDFIGVDSDGTDVLGKLFYYSLSKILIEKDTLAELCESVGFPYKPSRRTAMADAFRSATGDIDDSLMLRDAFGPQCIKVYCRDNKAPSGVISRELVKETVHEDTNEYKKLANISYTKEGHIFSYDNLVPDPHVDALKYCLEAQELFELYQHCAGRRQIETLLEHYVESMQAVKVSARGRVYFVPRDYMTKIQLFEDFIELLEANNKFIRAGRMPLDSNSMYVVDDAKQRQKMAAAFYRTVRAEIAEYEKQAANLIQNGNQSPSILDRCVLRIRGLEEKKVHYEEVLKQELHDLDDQFTSLRYLSDELQLRARGLRYQRKAA